MNKRYSRIAPFSLAQRVNLATAALNFFSPMEYEKMCGILGKTPATKFTNPFNGRDFINYLESLGLLPEAGRYSSKIDELLTELSKHGVLKEVSRSGTVLLGANYYFVLEVTSLQKTGILWLARALGPEFLYSVYAQATVQITGITKSGDIHAGTGLIIAPNWILTCAHVLTDMAVDEGQSILGVNRRIVRILPHPRVDVGLLEVEQPMPLLTGVAFRNPIVAETVFTLGYPRVPLSREAALVMQRGEVTNPSVSLLDGSVVFLYSAIARPGNSGGPIVSDTGHVVGIVTEELSEKADGFRMPFHAGVQTQELIQAVRELGIPVTLPVELYE